MKNYCRSTFRISFLALLLFLPFGQLAAKKIRSLKKHQIHHISAQYDTSVLRLPGNVIPLGITAITLNGDKFQTKGFLNGNIRWGNFRVNAHFTDYLSGKIRLHPKSSYLKGQFVEVVASSKHHNVKTKVHIPYNYETSIKLRPNSKLIKSPGRSVGLAVEALFDNEVSFCTTGKTRGYHSFDRFRFYSSGGSVSSGRLFINDDIFSIENHTVYVNAHLKSNPEISSGLSFKLDYVDRFIFTSYGISGFKGFDGTSGTSGMSGGNGGDGQDGDDGRDGSHGHRLKLFADIYFDQVLNSPLMKVFVEDCYTGRNECFYVNPFGGSMDIYSIGGEGGDAGDGGDGGKGGDGFEGKQEVRKIKINDSTWVEKTIIYAGGNGGHGGRGGCGGDGGTGGNGGDIEIYLTKSAWQFNYIINAHSIAGNGGDGGDGGDSGKASKGGNGSPEGNSGRNGTSGTDGSDGYDGRPGNIFLFSLDSFDFW